MGHGYDVRRGPLGTGLYVMAGVMRNLVYRMSISAIVGALVAGGLIYLSNDGIARSLQAEMHDQRTVQLAEQQALIEALGEVATLNTANAAAIAELTTKVEAMIVTVETHIDHSDHADHEEHDTAFETFSSDVYETLDEIKATLAEIEIAPTPVVEE